MKTTADQVRAAFARDGFVGPFELNVSRDRIESIADRLERMLTARSPHPLYGRFSVRDWHLLDDELLDVLARPEITDIVSAVLAPDLLLWRSGIFLKRPGAREIGWHQEWGTFNGTETGNNRPALEPGAACGAQPWSATVWVAFDDVAPDMGPMRFARGTHRWRFPAMQRALTGSATVGFDPRDFETVDVPMPCGWFVVFCERTMHGSDGNRSNRRRLAVSAHYTRSDTVVYPFRERGECIDGSNLDISRHECIVVAGRPRTDRNALRANALCDMRRTAED